LGKNKEEFLLNIGWFSTGRDEAARQLLQAVQSHIHSGKISGRISFVFSNREPGESPGSDLFFKLVDSYEIPHICLSHKKFKNSRTADSSGKERITGISKAQEDWRLSYDRAISARIEKFAPDLCVLAGYMLVVGEELCRQYNMINLHPASPGGPVGSWQEVIWQLIKSKAPKTGAMIHLVTPDLDRGPVISYCSFPITGQPFAPYWRQDNKEKLFQLIREHELAREFPLIISTLHALGQAEISIKDGKVVDAHGRILDGYDLSSEINRTVKYGKQ